MFHTFDGPCYTKNEISIMFFHAFLIFHVARSIKNMQHGYSLNEDLNLHPTSTPTRNLSKTLGRQLKIQVEKMILLFYYFLIFLHFDPKNGESSPMVDIIILNPIGSYKVNFFVHFSQEAHFRPQNSPNASSHCLQGKIMVCGPLRWIPH